ncbi:MAG: InlB B-repeat-containing protein, partial [Clostridiales Family XIII bacterium]|nr:InlB B-repeat-containing protein [Clostridiales Family XIII bacterium]
MKQLELMEKYPMPSRLLACFLALVLAFSLFAGISQMDSHAAGAATKPDWHGIKVNKFFPRGADTIALMENGYTYVWGGGSYHGQLGNGRNDDVYSPERLDRAAFGGESVRWLSSGRSNTSFAMTSGGALYGWGVNYTGQLCDDTKTNSTSPKLIPAQTFGGNDIKSIVTTENWTVFAITSGGEVYAWGDNATGLLGNGTTNSAVNYTPQLINKSHFNNESIKTMASGYGLCLALTENGKLYAWGKNNSGQLGKGTIDDNLHCVPEPIDPSLFGGEKIAAISAAYYNGFALTESGRLYSWGDNDWGQIGDGTNHTKNPTPTAISVGGEKVKSISSGMSHCLALTESGKVYAWGANNNGEIGNGKSGWGLTQDSPTPCYNLSGVNIVSIDAGGEFSMAFSADGTIYSWGRSDKGRIGRVGKASVPAPINFPYCNVTFEPSGGSWGGYDRPLVGNALRGLPFGSEFMPPEPTRDGYIFSGWNYDPQGNGDELDADTAIGSMVSAAVVYAQWEKDPNANNGNGGNGNGGDVNGGNGNGGDVNGGNNHGNGNGTGTGNVGNGRGTGNVGTGASTGNLGSTAGTSDLANPNGLVMGFAATQKTVYVKRGKTVKLPYIAYTTALGKQTITWKASKKKIATVRKGKAAGVLNIRGSVDSKLTIKAGKKLGMSKITLTATNGKRLVIRVKVVKNLRKVTKLPRIVVKGKKAAFAGKSVKAGKKG